MSLKGAYMGKNGTYKTRKKEFQSTLRFKVKDWTTSKTLSVLPKTLIKSYMLQLFY
jgi:hypothetical protein